MDTHKVANEYRLSQWAQVMQERRNRGQSVKEYCQRSGISRNAYFYWQRKLRKRQTRPDLSKIRSGRV